MSENDTFNHQKRMYQSDDSKTYKMMYLKNDDSMWVDDEIEIKSIKPKEMIQSSVDDSNIIQLDYSTVQNEPNTIMLNQKSLRTNKTENTEAKQSENQSINNKQLSSNSLFFFKVEYLQKNYHALGNRGQLNSMKQIIQIFYLKILISSHQQKNHLNKLDLLIGFIYIQIYKNEILIMIMFQKKSKNRERFITFTTKKTMKKSEGIFLFLLIRVKPKIQNYIQLYTSFGRRKQLTKQISDLINDPTNYSFINQAFYQNKIFSFLRLDKIIKFIIICYDLFFKLLDYLPLFNPENKLRILINVVIACYSSFFLIIVSLTLFFNAHFGQYEHIFHEIATVAWISEMLLSMNTYTYHNGQFITDRKHIITIYLKEYFFFEVLPLVFEGKSSSNIYINVLVHLPLLLKIKGISIILTKIEFFILQHIQKHHAIQFFKLIVQILLLTHMMACSYQTLGLFEKNMLKMENNWIDKSELYHDNHDWWKQYCEAQNWAFLTMSSSYSNSVHSKYEYSFTSFWMLISCILYAYLINMIGDILRDVSSQSENYKKDLNILNRYMKRKKIDIELQRVMNIHLKQNYYHFSKKTIEEEQQALNQLGQEMKEKLLSESNKNILTQYPFFQEKLSQESLSILYNQIEEETYTKGEQIHLSDSHNCDYFIYLVLKGEVTLQYDLKREKIDEDSDSNSNNCKTEKEKILQKSLQSSQIQVLKKENKQISISKREIGKCFGEFEFFTQSQANYTAQCTKNAIVVKISYKKFIQIIQQNKKDYEQFRQLQDELIYKKAYSLINGLGCSYCRSINHLFENCHLVHYSKQNPFIIPKSNRTLIQERTKEFERKQKGSSWIVIQNKPVSSSNINESSENEMEGSTFKLISNKNIEKLEECESQLQGSYNNLTYGQDKNDNYQNTIYSKERRQTENRQPSQSIFIEDQPSNLDATESHMISNFNNNNTNNPNHSNSLNNNNSSNLNIRKSKMEADSPGIQEKNYQSNLCNAYLDDVFRSKESIDYGTKHQRKKQLKASSILVDVNDYTVKVPSFSMIKEKRASIKRTNPFVIVENQTEQQDKYKSEMSVCHVKFNEKLNQTPWNESSTYWLFDQAQTFEKYFPQMNYKEVLKIIMHNNKKNANYKKKKNLSYNPKEQTTIS